MNNAFNALMIVLAAAMISACSTTGGSAPPEIRTGVVEQVNLTEVKSTHDQGLGAIIGGVAGAGLGSLIGAGTGRDVAIAAGAIAGAIGGNVAQNRYFDKPSRAAVIRAFAERRPDRDHAAGKSRDPARDAVYVEGTGHEARVVPA
jgi:outer membrane lipoprotein SlyB